MRTFFLLCLLSASLFASAQLTPSPKPQPDQQPATVADTAKYSPSQPHAVLFTIGAGFFDGWRSGYKFPAGFKKGNFSGFSPLFARVELAVSRSFSLGFYFTYDAFTNNYSQVVESNGGTYYRPKTDISQVFGAGFSVWYHFGKLIRVRNLDPFIGVGVEECNFRQGALPQGDSTVAHTDHTINPSLKAGARYYFSPKCSLYADAGFDMTSKLDVGFSCRFFSKKQAMKK